MSKRISQIKEQFIQVTNVALLHIKSKLRRQLRLACGAKQLNV